MTRHKLMCFMFGGLSIIEGLIALQTMDHFGDMHVAWATNSCAAALFWWKWGIESCLSG